MSPELFDPRLVAHLNELVPPRALELSRMEEIATREKFPIIGPAAGQYCYLMACLIGAQRIFELGSGFGYSTAWFARAVRENGGGAVHHVVWDDELSERAREHLKKLGFDDLVHYHVGEAVATLRESRDTFDIIFNDIDKEGYPGAMEAIYEHLRPGGLLIVDNLIWSGRIFDPTDTSPATTGVRELTRIAFNDPRWTPSIVPIRDGMLVARRN